MIVMFTAMGLMGYFGFKVYQKLNEPKQQSVEEIVKEMYDLNDDKQKAQYEELMRAWNYQGKPKESIE
jgi:hypothetical protein